VNRRRFKNLTGDRYAGTSNRTNETILSQVSREFYSRIL
jgi:hypothetical protein